MKISEITVSKWSLFSGIISLIIMITIFLFSCENGESSSDTSGFFSEFTASFLINGYEDMSQKEQAEALAVIDHIIRKAAHFSIYAALGFFTSASIGKRRLISKGTAAALSICFLYACSDELHQYFVPKRSCAFTDVIIDTSGAVIGIIISLLFINFLSHIHKTQ